MILKGKYSIDEIADTSGLTIEEVQQLESRKVKTLAEVMDDRWIIHLS